MSDPDPSLPVPELPALSRELGSPAFPLHRTPPLDDDPPFTLAGARASVVGGCARGVNDVRAGGVPLVARLRLEGAITASATLTPVGLERQLRLGETGVVERVVVAQADPVCFFEWGAELARPLALCWTVPAGAVRWRATERGLVVERPEGRALYALSGTPAALVVEPVGGDGPGGALRVRARVAAADGASVRLAVAAVGAGAGVDDEARVLRVMGRSHVVVPARRSAVQRVLEERLSLEDPDRALGQALAWAVIRLGDRVAAGPLSARELRLALASLAAGDPAPARALIAWSGSDDPGPTAAHAADAARADSNGHARRLLLVARYLAWTGDLRTVRAVWADVERRASALLESGGAGGAASAGESALAALALRELVPAAEEVGDEGLARRLRGAVDPGMTAGRGAAAVEVAVGEVAAGEVVAGEVVAEDPAAPGGSAAPGESEGGQGVVAAAMVEAVVEGLLGVEPDAPRGRLVLRPRLPRSWGHCVVRNLRVGGASVELELEREGGRHAFTLRQVSGGAPLRVIFEPELEGERLVAARVDGEAAELDAEASEGRVRVPVQVVLDHERRVVVEIGEASH